MFNYSANDQKNGKSKIKITQQSSNGNITIVLYQFEAYNRGYINYDFTVGNGTGDITISPTGTLGGQEISSLYIFATKSYTWENSFKEFEPITIPSSSVTYTIAHPNLTITAGEPYVVGGGAIQENEEYIYPFTISNGDYADTAVNTKLTIQTKEFKDKFIVIKANCEEHKSARTAGVEIDNENGKVNVNIGRIEAGGEITVKLTVKSRLLGVGQKEGKIENIQAILTEKTTENAENPPKVTLPTATIKENTGLNLDDVQRERLNDMARLCSSLPEIRLEIRAEKVSDVPGKRIFYLTDIAEKREIYCIEPGAYSAVYGTDALPKFVREWGYSRELIELWARSEHNSQDCGDPPDVQHYEYASSTYFCCMENHYTESSSFDSSKLTSINWTKRSEKQANMYDIGFIVSWTAKWTNTEGSGWSVEQQQALWESWISAKQNNKEKYLQEGQRVLDIAKNYRDFYQKIMNKEDGQEFGMKAKSLIEYETAKDSENSDNNTTSKDKVRMEIYVDQERELIKIGPFKVDYLNGSYETTDKREGTNPVGTTYNYSFGGISDMYLIDENNNRINLVNIIKVNEAEGPGAIKLCKVDYPTEEKKSSKTFFNVYDLNTNEDDGNLMDWNDLQKDYPRPGEEFYIEISTKYDFNRDGEINSNDYMPAAVKLKVDFQYLKSTAGICYRDGRYYYVDQDSWKESDTHTHTRGTEPDEYEEPCDTYHKKANFNTGVDHQDSLYILEDNRELVNETLIISTGPYLTTTMKLGGFVFEEAIEGKDSKWNGLKTDADLKLANVKVELYDAANNELAKLRTLAEERPNYRDENGNEVKGVTEEQKNDRDDYSRRTNPTLTDEQGYYEFRGVDITKRYYVKFTYNGQTYIPTDYMTGADIKKLEETTSNYGHTQEWKQASKGTERDSERAEYDNRFASIGSSPNNYVSTNNLGLNLPRGTVEGKTGPCNETYSVYDLAGITLNHEGKYVYNEAHQLIDSYYSIDDGYVVDNSAVEERKDVKAVPGLITKTIRNYIDNKDIRGQEIKSEYVNKEHLYPTDEVMKNFIYQQIVAQIAGNNKELQTEYWKKLQFIEDCKISSYTKQRDVEENQKLAENTYRYNTYPYNKQFTIFIQSGPMYPNNSYYNPTNQDDNGTYQDKSETGNVYPDKVLNVNGDKKGTNIKEVKYMNVYEGQLFINQGLVKRAKYDVALKKDVYKATLTINGKTQVYKYDERDVTTEAEKTVLAALEKQYGRNSTQYLDYKTELENKYWDLQARMLGYADYYDAAHNYNRELYESDFYYAKQNKLEAYITYKLTIRNQSQGILAQIDEVVDYFDKTYEPQWNKSWVMYKNDSSDDNENVRVRDQEFYDIMVGDRQVANGKFRSITSSGFSTAQGDYSANTRFGSEFAAEGYNTLYVDGLKDKKLDTGESAYIYLTFKVKGEGSGLALMDGTTDPGKQNIAEINGYSSFYADGTTLPNNVTKNSNDVAGLIDVDSNPGNFRVKDLKNRTNNRYEQNFEDDADRARGIRVFVQQGPLERIISGVAFEDKRTKAVDDALIGDGIRQDGDNGDVRIKNILVELLEVELDADGNVKFDENGDIITKKTIYQSENAQKGENGNYYVAEIYQPGNPNPVPAKALTDKDGYYEFKGLVPGDYIVRFTYGGEYLFNGEKKSNAYYNGQDYKTTSYQVGITETVTKDQRTDVAKPEDPGYTAYTEYGNYNDTKDNEGKYQQNASGTYGYDIYLADNNRQGNVSDAKDLWRYRAAVNKDNSNDYSGVTFKQADRLSKHKEIHPETQMVAETGVIRAEFEYNRQNSMQNSIDGVKQSNNNYGGTPTGRDNYTSQNNNASNDNNGTYHIQNVDLGLEERPKAGLELNKRVSNIKITLANGNILVDSDKIATNLTWIDRKAYNINQYKNNAKVYDLVKNSEYFDITEEIGPEVTSGSENVYSDYQKYDRFRDFVLNRVSNYVKKENGLIYFNMDDELMHGAQIQITYDMTVTNIGEVDYKETTFYYTGKIADKKTIVTTSADIVQDYVSNNLQFRQDSNKPEWGWERITNDKIVDNGYVNEDVAQELIKYNMTIQTASLKKDLIPVSTIRSSNLADQRKPITPRTQAQTTLILSQVINPQNTDDDLDYANIAEIVKISNSVGRRMAYSVQGNQKPNEPPTEPDASYAERFTITKPTGGGDYIVYIAIAVVVIAMLGAGIIIIKKTVLK